MLWHEDLHCGKHMPAIIDLARKATALRPDIVKNWCMLASFLIQAGEDEQAITVLTEAISKLRQIQDFMRCRPVPTTKHREVIFCAKFSSSLRQSQLMTESRSFRVSSCL